MLGMAPLMKQGDVFTFIGGSDLFDYHDFVYPEGQEDLFFPALLDTLQLLEWRRLELNSLPEFSPTLQKLPALLQSSEFRVTLEKEDVSPGVALPKTWDEYLAELRKKDRHELRRKLRRIEMEGTIRFECVLHDDLDGAIDDLLGFMRRSHDQKVDFLTPQRESFFRLLTRQMGKIGFLRLYFLELNGKRVAAVVCFDFKGIRYLYNSGFDPDYGHLSVGLLLKALCLKDAIEQGFSYFDFLRGKEPYKYHLGAKDVDLYRLIVDRGNK
jgi:CelD/BcsL family acetyltransferase involved in cellulose biosynthesis